MHCNSFTYISVAFLTDPQKLDAPIDKTQELMNFTAQKRTVPTTAGITQI